MTLIVGLDIGTSSVKAIVFNTAGEPLYESKVNLIIQMEESGFVEQSILSWWEGSIQALRQLSEQLGPAISRVEAIGLSGQCPSFTLAYVNGETMVNGILYSDNRAIKQTEHLIQTLGANYIRERTGEVPTPFFIFPKLLWFGENRQEFLSKSTYVLQPRDYVGWKLTGRLATDPTHAACTLLYDIHTGQWISEWLDTFGLNNIKLPEVIASDSLLGTLSANAASLTHFPQGLPIIIGGADSLCAVFGAERSNESVIYDISGTSTCLHLLINEPTTIYSINTYPHVIGNHWCAEVGVNTTGAAIQWIANTFQISTSELFQEATQINPGSDGLYFLPHLAKGERDNPARPGAFIGLQLGNTRGHMFRSVLEGVAFALCMRMELLKKLSKITRVVSSGGGTGNDFWNQMKADIFGLPVETVLKTDTTVFGAAKLAARNLGLSIGYPKENSRWYFPNLYDSGRYKEIYNTFLKLEELLSGPLPIKRL